MFCCCCCSFLHVFFFALSLSISVLFVRTRLEKPHHNHESVYHCVCVCMYIVWQQPLNEWIKWNKIKAIARNAYSKLWLAWHYVSGTFKCCRIEIECVHAFKLWLEIRCIRYLVHELIGSERPCCNKIKINV